MNLATNLSELHSFLHKVRSWPEYRAISDHYGVRRAERSQVPLINHIHEGIVIIGALDGMLPDERRFNDRPAAAGYCLHPLFQNDLDLMTFGQRYAHGVHRPLAGPVMLTMEYRWRANNWLSDKVQKGEMQAFPARPGPIDFDVAFHLDGKPDAGNLPEVRAMLIADKVQNYKDFLAHHKGTHARSDELDLYFRTWLDHLSINEKVFKELCDLATAVTT